ncbi:DUF934 domain-containing protein [Pseudoduganella danionis]|uniref:DUF934 domain-containing protein n=1 Tax=Pseudoduganella danionis TaxID=1890295 RepID=A0ABW9SN59_9BURK|nr:DUF934 domain-containing protein [Pseudoduganella danionis]MTW33451.1 DUF934 domain-containing protein [Pseudoduganella danionis]
MHDVKTQNAGQIIKGRSVVEDQWLVLRGPELPEGVKAEAEDIAALAVPAGKVIVPVAVWNAQREALLARAANGEIGVWFASDERPEPLKDDLAKFAVVAVDFPKFTDGRGYSIAYNLRTRLGWTGELRAIGDVLRDQLFSMQRVGFDAYAVRADRNIHDALKGLSDFSETYQASVDQKVPLFRRHTRNVGVNTGDAGFGI